jgi:hypothetical protein
MSGAMPFVATGFQLYGTLMQSQAIEAEAEANAQFMRSNAAFYESAAMSAREKAAWDERVHRQKVRELVGQQRAGYAYSGVKTTTGSPFEVISETLIKGEQDALNIRYGGAVEAHKNLMAARMYRQKAAYVEEAGDIGSTAALITGLGSTMISANELGIFDFGGSSRSSSPTKIRETGFMKIPSYYSPNRIYQRNTMLPS